MAVGTVSPVAVQQFFDDNGDPLAGGQLSFYQAGTSTPTPVFSDVTLTTPLSNPVILDAAGRAPQLFLDAVAYKQMLATAAGVTIWSADWIITPAALRSGSTTISLTGSQHDVAVPTGAVTFVELRNSSLLTIDGFSGGTPGQLLILRALGTGQVDLINADQSTSQPQNQLIHFVASGPTSLVGVLAGSGGAGTAMYIKTAGGYWILVAHEQGGFIRLPYVAGNFQIGGGAGTWTVEAGDVQQLDVQLSGSTLLITVAIRETVIGGTPTALRIAGFPYQWRSGAPFLPTVFGDGAGFAGGLMAAAANANVLDFAKVNFAAMTAGSGYIYAQAQIDVL